MEMETKRTITKYTNGGLVQMTYIPQTSAGVGCRIPIEWVPRLDALQKYYGVFSRSEVLRNIIQKEITMPETRKVTMNVDKSGLVVQNPTGPLTGPNGRDPVSRVITPQERRVIFSKLDEVYDPQKGYEGTWTDFRLAEHLRIPLSFVRLVREEMFGPLKSNAVIDEALEQCEKFLEKLTEAQDRAQDAFARSKAFYDNHLKGIQIERERVEKHMVEIKESLGK